MFSFRTTPLDRQEDLVLRRGNLAVLCNQSAWDPERQEYLFGELYRSGRLRKVFYPADGLFGEILPDGHAMPSEQPMPSDQPMQAGQSMQAVPPLSLQPGAGKVDYGDAFGMAGCRFVPLQSGPDGESSLDPSVLEDVDALIVEYQDTGSRYDSMTAVLYDVFQMIHLGDLPVSVYILDRENICGRQVEGTPLCPGSSVAAGLEGIPHRHGLTLGELANLFYSELGARFPLHIISFMVRPATQYLMPWSIPPRPDVPGLFTSGFYCGMVLLSGTDLSWGEGTARPYEFIGAPYLKDWMRDCDPETVSDAGVFLRRTVFTPRFGRWAGQACYGMQLLPRPGIPYHSVAHALRILRAMVSDGVQVDVSMLPDVIGDEILYGYVGGSVAWEDMKEHIKVEEQKWIRKARRYMLYDDQLSRVKTIKL